jgi:hypothetical protein
MEKRINRDSPELAVKLAIIWQRAEFQQGVVISNAVR